jgi:hypothetical protein
MKGNKSTGITKALTNTRFGQGLPPGMILTTYQVVDFTNPTSEDIAASNEGRYRSGVRKLMEVKSQHGGTRTARGKIKKPPQMLIADCPDSDDVLVLNDRKSVTFGNFALIECQKKHLYMMRFDVISFFNPVGQAEMGVVIGFETAITEAKEDDDAPANHKHKVRVLQFDKMLDRFGRETEMSGTPTFKKKFVYPAATHGILGFMGEFQAMYALVKVSADDDRVERRKSIQNIHDKAEEKESGKKEASRIKTKRKKTMGSSGSVKKTKGSKKISVGAANENADDVDVTTTAGPAGAGTGHSAVVLAAVAAAAATAVDAASAATAAANAATAAAAATAVDAASAATAAATAATAAAAAPHTVAPSVAAPSAATAVATADAPASDAATAAVAAGAGMPITTVAPSAAAPSVGVTADPSSVAAASASDATNAAAPVPHTVAPSDAAPSVGVTGDPSSVAAAPGSASASRVTADPALFDHVSPHNERKRRQAVWNEHMLAVVSSLPPNLFANGKLQGGHEEKVTSMVDRMGADGWTVESFYKDVKNMSVVLDGIADTLTSMNVKLGTVMENQESLAIGTAEANKK